MENKRQPDKFLETKKILALLNALADLIRFNHEQGYEKVAEWYKDVFDEILPVAEILAGCNLKYKGVNS